MKTRTLIITGIIVIFTVSVISISFVSYNQNQIDKGVITTEDEKSTKEQCAMLDGMWDEEHDGCKNITDNQCSLMGGFFVTFEDICAEKTCSIKDTLLCTKNYGTYMNNVEGTEIQLEGVIMDMRLGADHQYSFFTNKPYMIFNTGSTGITLEGIDEYDDLHGKVVELSGTRTERDLRIKVDDIIVTGSLIPSPKTANPVLSVKDILDVSLDDLYENPDQYYNRFVRIAGDLREYENNIAYAGVGCDTAKYTTSDEFVSDFPSSRHLHDGDKNIGVRIETSDDLGKVKEPLPSELKTNKVTVMGIFVPNVVGRGDCDHVIHKSGFLLTKLDDIKIDGGCVKTTFPDDSGMVVCD